MKKHPQPAYLYPHYAKSKTDVYIQAPLPDFLNTLPILVTIEGRGSGRQGPSPSTPREEPAND